MKLTFAILRTHLTNSCVDGVSLVRTDLVYLPNVTGVTAPSSWSRPNLNNTNNNNNNNNRIIRNKVSHIQNLRCINLRSTKMRQGQVSSRRRGFRNCLEILLRPFPLEVNSNLVRGKKFGGLQEVETDETDRRNGSRDPVKNLSQRSGCSPSKVWKTLFQKTK
jgi:hypothetical protein